MTLAEIKKAFQENTDLQKKVAIWVSSTEQGKEILANHAKIEVDKAVKEKTAELYTNIDNDIHGILGERKGTSEKTYDYVKKLVGEYKKLKEKAGDLTKDKKVKELEEQIKTLKEGGASNEHWKKLHDDATAKFTKEKEQLVSKLKEKEQEFVDVQINGDLDGGLKGLEFNKSIPQAAIDALVLQKKLELKKSAKIIDGKVVYHDKDGNALTNGEYKPKNSKEIWETELKDFFGESSTNGNSNGGGANTTVKEGTVTKTKGEGDNTEKYKLTLEKGSFSTQVEFTKLAKTALLKEGLKPTSQEYKEAMVEAYKEYEVKSLDLQ